MSLMKLTNQSPANPRKFRGLRGFLLRELCVRRGIYKSLFSLENS